MPSSRGIGQLAAAYLRSQGVEAESLDGGMQAWSLAWNLVEFRQAGGVTVIQVRRTGKGCLSSSWPITARPWLSTRPWARTSIGVAGARGLKILGVVDTHVHADHLSRSRLLAQDPEIPHYLPTQDRVHFPLAPLRDGDRIPLGGTALEVLQSPGHTWESSAYVHALLARIPPPPPNHHRIVAFNETGRWPEDDPTVLEAGANRCAVG